MNKQITILLITFLLTLCESAFGASYTSAFSMTYQRFPNIPKGVLESVAWCNTRIANKTESTPSCIAIPAAIGVMGLIYDGKDYFRTNGQLVASFENQSSELNAVERQIDAYGAAFNHFYMQKRLVHDPGIALYLTLVELSEIPLEGVVNSFALDAQLYQVFSFLGDENFAQNHGFSALHFNLKDIFGAENLRVLKSKKVLISENQVKGQDGTHFLLSSVKSAEYGPAIWTPAPSCNISSRNGTAISAITIHTIQGSYAGAISWSQNCSAGVSYHYVIRSSDGQVTQMVDEQQKAWHVGSENPYTIGYEHEGWIDDPQWYTTEMYESSAALSRDIVNSGYGILPNRTFFGAATVGTNTLGSCTRIKGHQHFPNQSHTDPGINWDWKRYYNLVNSAVTPTVVTASQGALYDSGGDLNAYASDEHLLWLLEPPSATSIQLTVTSFDVEEDWDFLFVYAGSHVSDSLVGMYTGTTIPSTISIPNEKALLEFRSDCAITAPGWKINFAATAIPEAVLPSSGIALSPDWKTDDFSISITDHSAQSTISDRFYFVENLNHSSNVWKANEQEGMLNEVLFDPVDWVEQSGVFNQGNGGVFISDELVDNSNCYKLIDQSSNLSTLYRWKQQFTGSGTNQRAGMHFMCSDPTLPNRGESYFVFLREASDMIQLYKVENDVFSLKSEVPLVVNSGVDYDIRVVNDPQNGWIKVYVGHQLKISWQDGNPIQQGNSVSFRTGNAAAVFKELQIAKERTSNLQMTVGSTASFFSQSVSGVKSARLFAMCRDVNYWSLMDTMEYLVDYSAPEIDFVNDGVGNDIAQFETDAIAVNWGGHDDHSGVESYQIRIGTAVNGSEILTWQNVGLVNDFTLQLANLIEGQWYFTAIEATDNAGNSSVLSSNGQQYVSSLSSELLDGLAQLKVYPNPTKDVVYLENLPSSAKCTVMDMHGKEALQIVCESTVCTVNLKDLSEGVYHLIIQTPQAFSTYKINKQ